MCLCVCFCTRANSSNKDVRSRAFSIDFHVVFIVYLFFFFQFPLSRGNRTPRSSRFSFLFFSSSKTGMMAEVGNFQFPKQNKNIPHSSVDLSSADYTRDKSSTVVVIKSYYKFDIQLHRL